MKTKSLNFLLFVATSASANYLHAMNPNETPNTANAQNISGQSTSAPAMDFKDPKYLEWRAQRLAELAKHDDSTKRYIENAEALIKQNLKNGLPPFHNIESGSRSNRWE